MTSTDAPPPTRRSLRATHPVDVVPDTAESALDVPDAAPPAPPAALAEAPHPDGHAALEWVDEVSVATASQTVPALSTSGAAPAVADLLASAPRRSPLRAGVIVPSLIIAGLVGGYAATTLLWPLHAVAPEIRAVQVDAIPAAAATPAWPAEGAAGISIRGIPGNLTSTPDAWPIASITKVVTALVVLDEMPLAPGEQGPEFRFGYGDSDRYWEYRNRGESALDVPVDGSLTQYQMLQGMLIGSANNYADRLASNLWPNDEVYARAAADWLDAHGVTGIHIVEPTGIDPENTATNGGLLELAVKALANPVVAEIVRTPAVELPGAGYVENTNDLVITDPGMLGIKTGYYDTYNLLSAKDVEIAGTTVRMYGSVLGQPDPEMRSAATVALYAQAEAELQPRPSVAKGATVGIVETRWGERITVTTDADASVILWNGGAGTIETKFDLGDHRAAGDAVGSLTVTGPLDTTTVDLRLDADVEPPSPWWRLTHPLDLFGLAG